MFSVNLIKLDLDVEIVDTLIFFSFIVNILYSKLHVHLLFSESCFNPDFYLFCDYLCLGCLCGCYPLKNQHVRRLVSYISTDTSGPDEIHYQFLKHLQNLLFYYF